MHQIIYSIFAYFSVFGQLLYIPLEKKKLDSIDILLMVKKSVILCNFVNLCIDLNKTYLITIVLNLKYAKEPFENVL